MRDKKPFLNVTFKVEKNPTYTGNHFMARVNNVGGCTFPLGTTEQEMIDQYHNSVVLEKDIDGKRRNNWGGCLAVITRRLWFS